MKWPSLLHPRQYFSLTPSSFSAPTGRGPTASVLTHEPSLQVLNPAHLRKPVNVRMHFSNPLDEPVNNCVLMVEGSGLLRGNLKIE